MEIKKTTVIIGKRASGKSRVAEAMACRLHNTIKVQPSHKGSFPFIMGEEDTEVIIFDEVNNINSLGDIIFSTYNYVLVEKPCKSMFYISPKIIIVCNEEITRDAIEKLGSSINRRINIIETLWK
jgi:energy-coupling factor transporter ATP-binding protein EcfA2